MKRILAFMLLFLLVLSACSPEQEAHSQETPSSSLADSLIDSVLELAPMEGAAFAIKSPPEVMQIVECGNRLVLLQDDATTLMVYDAETGAFSHTIKSPEPVIELSASDYNGYDMRLKIEGGVIYHRASEQELDSEAAYRLPEKLLERYNAPWPSSSEYVTPPRFDMIGDLIAVVTDQEGIWIMQNGDEEPLHLDSDILNAQTMGDRYLEPSEPGTYPEFRNPRLMLYGNVLVCDIVIPQSQAGITGLFHWNFGAGEFYWFLEPFELSSAMNVANNRVITVRKGFPDMEAELTRIDILRPYKPEVLRYSHDSDSLVFYDGSEVFYYQPSGEDRWAVCPDGSKEPVLEVAGCETFFLEATTPSFAVFRASKEGATSLIVARLFEPTMEETALIEVPDYSKYLEPYRDKGYAIYFDATAQHLAQWTEAFRAGEKAVLFFYRYGMSIQPDWAILLEANGSSSYLIKKYYLREEEGNEFSTTSSVVLKRATDYVFGSDMSTEQWFADWQDLVVHYGKLIYSFPDAPINELAPDAIEPEEAKRILSLRLGQWNQHRQNASRYFGDGSYFPLDLVPENTIPLEEIEEIGTMMIQGRPYYWLNWANVDRYAVSADGMTIFSGSQVSSAYRLLADSDQERIVAEHS